MKAILIFIILLLQFFLSQAFANQLVIDSLQLNSELYQETPEKILFIHSENKKTAYLQIEDHLFNSAFQLKQVHVDHCLIKIYISDIQLKKTQPLSKLREYAQLQIHDYSDAICDHHQSYDVRVDLIQTIVNANSHQINTYTSTLYFKNLYYNALDPVIPLH